MTTDARNMDEAQTKAKDAEDDDDDAALKAARQTRRGSVWYAELEQDKKWDPSTKPVGFMASYEWWAAWTKSKIYPPSPDILKKDDPHLEMTW